MSVAQAEFTLEDAAELLQSDDTIVAAESLFYFAYEYFPHLCELAPSSMHEDITEELTEVTISSDGDGALVAYAAPRGFAKTTIVSVIYPLWCAVNGYKRYIIQIQAASKNAEDQLENIKHELLENKKLREDYPNACGEGSVWRLNMIVMRNGVRIDALGSGQKVRGRLHHGCRPDLIVLDDVETDENVATPAQRDKQLRWYNRAVLKAGHKATIYIIIGTVLHTESMLAVLLQQAGYIARKYKAIISWADRQDLWDEWTKIFNNLIDKDRDKTARAFYERNRKEMLRGVEILWPERWDYYSLMVEFTRDGPYAFSSERQNDPAEADSLVTRDEISWYNAKELNPLVLEYIVGGVDPSLGKGPTSDFSAIIHVGLDSNGYMYVLNVSIARRKPDDIIKDSLEIARRRIEPWAFPLNQDAFLVETIQFQAYFKTNLDKASEEMHAYLPTIEVNPRVNKDIRISSLQPHIKNGYLKFRDDGSQETLIQQLCNFPHGKKDGPDCLSMIVDYITKHSSVGMAVVIPANLGYSYGQF